MSTTARGWFFRIALLVVVVRPGRAQQVPDGISVETLASGLSAPTGFEFLPDGRALFVEQFTARVRLFREGTGVQTTPVITVAGVSAGGERGLLGVAVDPRYPAFPYLYLYYDYAATSKIRISRYTLSGNLSGVGGGDLTADPATRFDLLDAIPDAASNHNGGTLRFGLDGLLYASLGDDANSCAAQTPGLRGAILRMETRTLPPGPGLAFYAQLAVADNPFHASTDSAAKLVAVHGLRNPFRIQLDPGTGDWMLGDVGLTLREELDLLSPPGGSGLYSPLGTNFGWPYYEGTTLRSSTACGTMPAGMVLPVFDYDRTQQADAAIIAAGIYRSQQGQPHTLPADHVGDLFANDYYSGVLYRLKKSGGVWTFPAPIPGQPAAQHWGEGFTEISDWRVGPDGAFWFCRQSVNFAAGSGLIGRVWGPGTLGVPPPEPHVSGYELRLRVSPAVGKAQLDVATPIAATLCIVDAQGRFVRRLPDGAGGVAPGALRTLLWDGRDDAGRDVPPGLYFAQLESRAVRTSVRVPFLR